MAICLSTSVAAVMLTANGFTLAWTHSVEHVRWEEVWRADGDALVLDAVRVRGVGAGMEPPPEAVLEDGAWRWHPGTRHAILRLARSPYVADYEWCEANRACQPLSAILPADDGVTAVRACPDALQSNAAPPWPWRSGMASALRATGHGRPTITPA